MSVNYGSSKIDKIDIGSSAIGKVYQGSTLVYQSQKSVRMYSFAANIIDGNVVSNYMVGSKDANGLMLFLAGFGGKIYKTQGTMGQSGSQICYALQDSYSWDKWMPYSQTFVVNGVNIYSYWQQSGGFLGADAYLVIEGSTTEYVSNAFGEPTVGPVSITDEGVDPYGNGILAWTPQYDKIWTPNGIYDA